MQKLVFIIAFSLALIPLNLKSQEPGILDKESLEKLLDSRKPGKIYVYNFWATWCAPCVKEIAYFEDLHQDLHSTGVEVILINLDFPNQLHTRVIPFINEKNLSAKIYNMADMDYDSWISLVDDKWSGAIPATLIVKDDKRIFFEEAISKLALYENVKSL